MGQRSSKNKRDLLLVQGATSEEEEIIRSGPSLCVERLEQLETQITEIKDQLTRERSLFKSNEVVSDLREQLHAEKAKSAKWEAAYAKLHQRHEDYLESIAKKADVAPTSVISNGAISRFVDELLADPNINIYYMPDSIEKALYTNILKIVLSLVQKSLNHTNLDIIGHEFKMSMRPTEETMKQDEETLN